MDKIYKVYSKPIIVFDDNIRMHLKYIGPCNIVIVEE